MLPPATGARSKSIGVAPVASRASSNDDEEIEYEKKDSDAVEAAAVGEKDDDEDGEINSIRVSSHSSQSSPRSLPLTPCASSEPLRCA
jgi:hypothetical protein